MYVEFRTGQDDADWTRVRYPGNLLTCEMVAQAMDEVIPDLLIRYVESDGTIRWSDDDLRTLDTRDW